MNLKKILVGDTKESQSVKSIKRLMGLSSQEVSSLNINNLNLDLTKDLPYVIINDQKICSRDFLNNIVSFM